MTQLSDKLSAENEFLKCKVRDLTERQEKYCNELKSSQ